MSKNMKICVVGLGYIGLPTAAVFASRKIHVHGVDVNQDAVNLINQGRIHIVEPELDILVHSVVTEGFLKASTKPDYADAYILAVPTPFKGDNHDPDLSYIEAASRAIAPFLKPGNLVILESTSPVGATEKMARWLSDVRADLTFPQDAGENSQIRIAHCPERVLPGHVIRELVENDRIVGGMTERCAKSAVDLYKTFVEGECLITDARTAEMAKLTENSFRDVNIAFANELSIICDKINVDVRELISLCNRHPRVNVLSPGAGVGGHCIAVDPWFIVSKTPEHARLIRQARIVNESKPEWVVSKVESIVLQFLKENTIKTAADIKIACLGLAFKPDIDDLRESPALNIAQILFGKFGNKLAVVEPNIDTAPIALSEVNMLTMAEAVDWANILVVLVKHREFIELKSMIKSEQALLDVVGL